MAVPPSSPAGPGSSLIYAQSRVSGHGHLDSPESPARPSNDSYPYIDRDLAATGSCVA